ncbi:MAG: hypothetical protein F6K11_35185, partial [Leptolyngbya sp. SIO3F4]|nr:hypothetical protein [Leptolyngbya sp. SIO3F4]
MDKSVFENNICGKDLKSETTGNKAQEPTGAAQESALAFSEAAQGSVALQLQHKADFLKGLDGMINGAVDAIVAVEEDILS